MKSSEVLTSIVRERAGAEPDRVFLQHVDGSEWTYATLHREALTWAATFERFGVGPADPVLVMLPNSFDSVAIWLGLGWLKAYEVPLNTAYRGRVLSSVASHTEARVAVVADRFLDRFAEVAGELPDVQHVICVGTQPDGTEAAPWTTSTVEEARAGVQLEERSEPQPWDISTILHTSGTTGASKGVLVPWAQLHSLALGSIPLDEMGRNDAYYSPFPLFHASGKLAVSSMGIVNGRVVLREMFSTSQFWDDVKRFGCTTSLLMGTTPGFVAGLPRTDSDADNPLRNVLVAPLPSDPRAFAERFGIRLCTVFNMTEISSPIWTAWDVGDPKSCGRVREGFECRVVDEHDQEVEPGVAGELIVRADEPWTLMAGYYKRPEATADAWRNLWFHTGDLFTRDADGNFYYLDRTKDSIRRRGENISSLEVEREVVEHEAVLECAVVGVPAELAEEEVKAVVVVADRDEFSPEDLIRFLGERLPHFMVPRYVEVLDELPKTPTEKVRKQALRDSGVAGAWDRESAGVAVQR